MDKVWGEQELGDLDFDRLGFGDLFFFLLLKKRIISSPLFSEIDLFRNAPVIRLSRNSITQPA